MIIQLDENTKLATDENQWMLQKRKVVKGVTEWRSFAYFKDITSAAQYYAELMLRRSDVDTLAEAIKECKDIATRLTTALNPKYVVLEAG